MEHFKCNNTNCNAYLGNGKCMWKYEDNIRIDKKTCERIVFLIETKGLLNEFCELITFWGFIMVVMNGVFYWIFEFL